MNRTSEIADNCRSIIRQRCNNFNTSSQQNYSSNTWKPCNPILTNPIHSLYEVDNLRVPMTYCEEPSFYNCLSGLSPTVPSNNYPLHRNFIDSNRSAMQYASISSENCIQRITNAIITQVRWKIPQQEAALLCCCLPSLIRQMICKNPSLTPDAIIQWLSADIIKESVNCFDQSDFNIKHGFQKSKQDFRIRGRLHQQLKDKKLDDDHHSVESEEDDDNQSLSSHHSTTSERNSQEPFQSKSVLDVPKKHKKKKHKKNQQKKKKKKNHSPSSTRSFSSQRNKDFDTTSPHSLTPSLMSTENRSQKSVRDNPNPIKEDERSIASPLNKDSYLSINSPDSNEDFDEENLSMTSKGKLTRKPSSRIHLEYPGKKDPNAAQDLEKCLAFYQKVREYFDDDVAAMLFKCCLCYGGCSEKR